MKRHKFPASLPRKMYWSDEVGGLSLCPDCHVALESEHHTYTVATRRAGDIDMYFVGNPGGHFCGNCPVVVLDREEFVRGVSAAVRDAHGMDYTVLGLVDLEAIPKDKRHLPFDEDTNPIPLVEFTDVGEPNHLRLSGRGRPKSKKQKNREKRERRKRTR